MIELATAQRLALRARAQALQPVVSIAGNGLTPAVLNEIDRSLKAHELIKIRTYGIEREQRDLMLGEICDTLQCAPVQHIGNLLVVFRERPADSAGAVKPARPPKHRATKKQLSAGVVPAKPQASRRAAKPAAPLKPRRNATPNPPRRANNTRGR
jgi:putative YhbY family RNA-binding protein